MRSAVALLCSRRAQVIALTCLLAGLPLFASAGTYTNFDFPGAYSTVANGINNSGASVGSWSSGYGLPWAYGFVRQANGKLTAIVVSGANATIPFAINGPGLVVGYYEDANYVFHGFLCNGAGQFTRLNAPGAGWNTAYSGTYALSINDASQVAGFYTDERQVQHGFFRDASGNYTSFDPPGSVNTLGGFVNQSGEIAGGYKTSDGTSHGYLRDTSGNITTFDVPGEDKYGIYVQGINASGEIAGDYLNMSGTSSGFLRDASGVITTFDLPKGGVMAVGIQDDGDIIGQEYTSRPVWGFRRTLAGVTTSFDDPSAGASGGTYSLAVSGKGNIAGYYVDSSGLTHAFIWRPKN